MYCLLFSDNNVEVNYPQPNIENTILVGVAYNDVEIVDSFQLEHLPYPTERQVKKYTTPVYDSLGIKQVLGIKAHLLQYF